MTTGLGWNGFASKWVGLGWNGFIFPGFSPTPSVSPNPSLPPDRAAAPPAPRSGYRSSTRSPCASSSTTKSGSCSSALHSSCHCSKHPTAGPDLDDAAGPDLDDAGGPVMIDYLHLFCYPSQGKTKFVGAPILIGLGQFLVGGFGDGTRGCSWISLLCFTCWSVSSHLVSSDQALALVLSLLLVLRKTKDPMASRYKSDTSLTDLLSSLL